MKEWRFNDPKATTLLMSQITLLKGTIFEWQEVIERIRLTFELKEYDLFESEEKIHVDDYYLSILSNSDDYYSPNLKDSKDALMALFEAYLELSPFYKNLVESWEELQEEVELLSQELGYSAEVRLDNYKKNIVEDHLKWKSSKGNALEEMLQQIKLTKKSKPDKRHIFILISPEKTLNDKELVKLNDQLQQSPGYFIVVSDFSFSGSQNILYNDQIINQASVTSYKDTISTLLPFVFSENKFENSLKWYINSVGKSNGNIIKLSLSSVDNLEELIYVFIMIYVTQLPFTVDYTGIPEGYKKYIESIIESGV
ncbi:hypothetical protein SAMN04488102_1071 [Alkalibacterium subtropicum]|uniref:Uncharacterized protein n=1 Tax=Alkalibacterium subtropicum TaxID=753702 RepID=A0A1I1J5S7_9LACT|nr:hypothetical protein [Alkalibacterium subtropicum]SFC43927.1 hypothetical protein SAMN04488102_1071 [Alkalibacterium subtropicum]